MRKVRYIYFGRNLFRACMGVTHHIAGKRYIRRIIARQAEVESYYFKKKKDFIYLFIRDTQSEAET